MQAKPSEAALILTKVMDEGLEDGMHALKQPFCEQVLLVLVTHHESHLAAQSSSSMLL